MINILDPNLSISHGYDMWDVLLNNGKSIQGIISTETPNAIILRNEGGRETTIARQNIKSLLQLRLQISQKSKRLKNILSVFDGSINH